MVVTGPVPRQKRVHTSKDRTYLRDHASHIVQQAQEAHFELVKSVQDLGELIYRDPIVHALFRDMLVQVPVAYDRDASLRPIIGDIPTLLSALSYQIQQPISYCDLVQIGTPINALLD